MANTETCCGKTGGITRDFRHRLAAALCALLLTAVPLAWTWHIDRLWHRSLAGPENNPPITGHVANRAGACARESGYAPASEVPQVRLVNNPSTLEALQIARAGDVLLLYRQSRLMLLYDPLTDRILNRAEIPAWLDRN